MKILEKAYTELKKIVGNQIKKDIQEIQDKKQEAENKVMKITELTYSLGKTIQIKQYEPLSLHASIKAEVSPKEDLTKAYTELKKIVGNQIKKDIQEIQDKKQEAENKVKYPHGQCSTCGEALTKSKKGDLYCPNSFKNYEGNPHHQQEPLDQKIEKFKKSLK